MGFPAPGVALLSALLAQKDIFKLIISKKMETSSPFFSLVIPTKNRAHILKQSLLALLKQTCQDFVCCVIDNDDTDDTFKIFKELSLPDNFNYKKTGGLSMPDNWDFAVNSANGKYLIILEDKTLLKNNLLEILKNILCECPNHDCITWLQDVGSIDTIDFESFVLSEAKTHVISTKHVLKKVLASEWKYVANVMPRGFNSALSQRLYKGLLSSDPNFRLCRPYCPDYTLGFQALFSTDKILHLPVAGSFVNAHSPSNGMDAFKRGPLFKSYLNELGIDEADLFLRVPSKVFSVHNALTGEFFHLLERYGKESAGKLNIPRYYMNISYETSMRMQMGADITGDVQLFRKELSKLSILNRVRTIICTIFHHNRFSKIYGLTDPKYSKLQDHLQRYFF